MTSRLIQRRRCHGECHSPEGQFSKHVGNRTRHSKLFNIVHRELGFVVPITTTTKAGKFETGNLKPLSTLTLRIKVICRECRNTRHNGNRRSSIGRKRKLQL